MKVIMYNFDNNAINLSTFYNVIFIYDNGGGKNL